MDRITERAAKQVLADLVSNGGGTYERGTLLPFKPEGGFAVGIGGLNLPVNLVTVEAVAWAAKAVTTEYEAGFVGTWLHDGKVYFDAVAYYGDAKRALAAGRAAGQEAIYDFAKQEVIAL